MAKKSAYGRYIISAGEVGAYTVCPEAWRLKMVENVKGSYSELSTEGMRLHQEWAKTCSEALSLRKKAFAVISLLGLATVIFALFY